MEGLCFLTERKKRKLFSPFLFLAQSFETLFSSPSCLSSLTKNQCLAYTLYGCIKKDGGKSCTDTEGPCSFHFSPFIFPVFFFIFAFFLVSSLFAAFFRLKQTLVDLPWLEERNPFAFSSLFLPLFHLPTLFITLFCCLFFPFFE